MPKDGFGNDYLEMVGRSRLVNEKQRMALVRQPHEHRGCCPCPPKCCEAQVPKFSSLRQDGEHWTCPTCDTLYVYDTDEANGSAWFPVVGSGVVSVHE